MHDEVLTRQIAEPRTDLATALANLWRRRALLRQLVVHELKENYLGSALSVGWAVLHPAFTILLYMFVFGYIFTARLGQGAPETTDFTVYLLSGLICWLAVQQALTRGAGALLASANLVKQVVFPTELLPIKSVVAALVPNLIGLGLLLAYSALVLGFVSPLLPLVVVVLASQVLISAGCAMFLAALTVFVRDVREVVQFFAAFGIFLLPILYLPGALPGWAETLLYANPFSYLIWCMQDVFVYGEFRHPLAWGVAPALGLAAFYGGHAFFERTRGHFGDLL